MNDKTLTYDIHAAGNLIILTVNIVNIRGATVEDIIDIDLRDKGNNVEIDIKGFNVDNRHKQYDKDNMSFEGIAGRCIMEALREIECPRVKKDNTEIIVNDLENTLESSENFNLGDQI